jgi:hypothetical protein
VAGAQKLGLVEKLLRNRRKAATVGKFNAAGVKPTYRTGPRVAIFDGVK